MFWAIDGEADLASPFFLNATKARRHEGIIYLKYLYSDHKLLYSTVFNLCVSSFLFHIKKSFVPSCLGGENLLNGREEKHKIYPGL